MFESFKGFFGKDKKEKSGKPEGPVLPPLSPPGKRAEKAPEEKRGEAESSLAKLEEEVGLAEYRSAGAHPAEETICRVINELEKLAGDLDKDPPLVDLASKARKKAQELGDRPRVKEYLQRREREEAIKLTNRLGGEGVCALLNERDREKAAVAASKLAELARGWKENPNLTDQHLIALSRAQEIYKRAGKFAEAAGLSLERSNTLKARYLDGLKEDYLPTETLRTDAENGFEAAARDFGQSGNPQEKERAEAEAKELNNPTYGIDPEKLRFDEGKFPPEIFGRADGVTLKAWLHRLEERESEGGESGREITDRVNAFCESLRKIIELSKDQEIKGFIEWVRELGNDRFAIWFKRAGSQEAAAGDDKRRYQETTKRMASLIAKVSEDFYSLFYADDRVKEKWSDCIRIDFLAGFREFLKLSKLDQCVTVTAVSNGEGYDQSCMMSTGERKTEGFAVTRAHSWIVGDKNLGYVLNYASVDVR